MYKNGTFAVAAIFFVALVLAAVLIAGVTGSAFAGNEEKVTICHVSGNGHENTLTVGYNAVWGPAGHFNWNGLPRAGHLNDYIGPCGEVVPN